MLYCRTKPDAVLVAILHEAMESELEEITRISVEKDFDAWAAGYGQVCQHFSPYSAVVTLEALLSVNKKDTVYRLTDYHWLLIYECLKNYCALYDDGTNQQEAKCKTVGTYQLDEINFEEIVDLYFWDTDFLFLDDADRSPVTCQSVSRDNSGTEAHLTHDLHPHPMHLQLTPEDEPAWRLSEPHELYGIHSRRYPDFS